MKKFTGSMPIASLPPSTTAIEAKAKCLSLSNQTTENYHKTKNYVAN
jgi:hypothetical protein